MDRLKGAIMADTRLRAFGKTAMGFAIAAVVASALAPAPASAGQVSPGALEEVSRNTDAKAGMKAFEAEMDRIGKQASALERAEKALDRERAGLLLRIGEFRDLVAAVDDAMADPGMSARDRVEAMSKALAANPHLRKGGAMAALTDISGVDLSAPAVQANLSGVSSHLEGFLSDVVSRMAEVEDTVFVLSETNATKALLIDRMADRLDAAAKAGAAGDVEAAEGSWREFDDLIHVRSHPRG